MVQRSGCGCCQARVLCLSFYFSFTHVPASVGSPVHPTPPTSSAPPAPPLSPLSYCSFTTEPPVLLQFHHTQRRKMSGIWNPSKPSYSASWPAKESEHGRLDRVVYCICVYSVLYSIWWRVYCVFVYPVLYTIWYNVYCICVYSTRIAFDRVYTVYVYTVYCIVFNRIYTVYGSPSPGRGKGPLYILV